MSPEKCRFSLPDVCVRGPIYHYFPRGRVDLHQYRGVGEYVCRSQVLEGEYPLHHEPIRGRGVLHFDVQVRIDPRPEVFGLDVVGVGHVFVCHFQGALDWGGKFKYLRVFLV